MKQCFFSVSIFSCLLFSGLSAYSQFSPAVGQIGTSAMYKDSSAFIAWASECRIIRGLQDISVSNSIYANVGDSSAALGIAGTTGVVSLGDGGAAILQFVKPIKDGPGPDLAVFENGFNDTFLELAFVEVSSDGGTYFRFPATSNTDTTTQTGSFASTDATKINNLAGKYRSLYGTPFNLEDIPDNLLLNKQAITHVKIIDVVGCIQNQYCTRDINNHKVNDPWPTAFGSGGFDLDAVGVIHQQENTSVGVKEFQNMSLTVFPNPATDVLYIATHQLIDYSVSVSNLLGEVALFKDHQSNTCNLLINELKQGVYILTINAQDKYEQIKFIKY